MDGAAEKVGPAGRVVVEGAGVERMVLKLGGCTAKGGLDMWVLPFGLEGGKGCGVIS